MANVGIGPHIQTDVFRLLAGILHLGNIDFDEGESDGVRVATRVQLGSEAHLRNAAGMLGIPEERVLASIITQNMYVGGSTIVKKQTRVQVG